MCVRVHIYNVSSCVSYRKTQKQVMGLLIVSKRRRKEAYDKSWYKSEGNKDKFQSPSICVSSCTRTRFASPDLHCFSRSTIYYLFLVLGPRRLTSWTASLGPWPWLAHPIRGCSSRSMNRRRQMLECLFPALFPSPVPVKGFRQWLKSPGFLQALSFVSLAVCTAFQEQHSSSPSGLGVVWIFANSCTSYHPLFFFLTLPTSL